MKADAVAAPDVGIVRAEEDPDARKVRRSETVEQQQDNLFRQAEGLAGKRMAVSTAMPEVIGAGATAPERAFNVEKQRMREKENDSFAADVRIAEDHVGPRDVTGNLRELQAREAQWKRGQLETPPEKPPTEKAAPAAPTPSQAVGAPVTGGPKPVAAPWANALTVDTILALPQPVGARPSSSSAGLAELNKVAMPDGIPVPVTATAPAAQALKTAIPVAAPVRAQTGLDLAEGVLSGTNATSSLPAAAPQAIPVGAAKPMETASPMPIAAAVPASLPIAASLAAAAPKPQAMELPAQAATPMAAATPIAQLATPRIAVPEPVQAGAPLAQFQAPASRLPAGSTPSDDFAVSAPPSRFTSVSDKGMSLGGSGRPATPAPEVDSPLGKFMRVTTGSTIVMPNASKALTQATTVEETTQETREPLQPAGALAVSLTRGAPGESVGFMLSEAKAKTEESLGATVAASRAPAARTADTAQYSGQTSAARSSQPTGASLATR